VRDDIRDDDQAHQTAVRVLASSGVYGQWIFVVPGKDLVVVATGNARNVGDFALPLQLLYDTIIPAAH
jgi:CubicO group peptidase (beta-lactamase class C family)